MSDQFTIEADGSPVALTFGKTAGPHIIATVRPVGEMIFRSFQDWDHDDESKWSFTSHELIEARWKEHPDECPGTYELRDGDKAVGSFAFPSLNDNVTPEVEAQIDANWKAVRAFADEHKIPLDFIDKDFIGQALEIHLAQEAGVRSRLMRPRPVPKSPVAPASPARELSA